MPDEAAGSLPPPELLAALEAADRAEVIDAENDPPLEIKGKAETPPAKETPAEKEETKPTEAKPDSSKPETDKKSEDKQKSKYAQEQDRKNRTWQEINAEKAALQAEKERIAREKEEIRIAAVKSQPYRDQHGHTADAYEAFAKQAEAAGDKLNAEAAMKAAQAVRQEEQAAKQQAAAQDFQAKWTQNLEKLSQEHPELRNKESELYKEAGKKVENYPLLRSDPSGVNLAVEAVLIERKHKEIQSVIAENKSLKEQIETLQKKLSLSSGVAAEPPAGETPFNKLSEKEQRSQLEKLLEEQAMSA